MKTKIKTGVFPVLLMLVLVTVLSAGQASSQEAFSPMTPSQESTQSLKEKADAPVLRAGGGTGGGDGTNPGGGNDNGGHQNDTDTPVTDALPLILLMATAYLTVKNKKSHTHKNK